MDRFCRLDSVLWMDWLSIMFLGFNFAIENGFRGSDLLHGLCSVDRFFHRFCRVVFCFSINLFELVCMAFGFFASVLHFFLYFVVSVLSISFQNISSSIQKNVIIVTISCRFYPSLPK